MDTQDEIDNVFKERKKVYTEEIRDEYTEIMDKINKNYAYVFFGLS